jgi:hypothetical protein
MAHETFSVNIDSIHDQVHTAIRELCSAAERIRRVAAALEGSVEELVSHAPTEHLLQAGPWRRLTPQVFCRASWMSLPKRNA